MGETWFRGQSSNAPPVAGAQVGGHDLGDGVYYTDSEAVAGQYADTRVARSGGQRQVLAVTFERAELGRILDLRQDARWRTFLDRPMAPGSANTTPRGMIQMANQNYAPLFQTFLRDNAIDIRQYDVVIAEEFVRGGYQLCVLNVNGAPSALAQRLQARWRPVGAGGGAAANFSVSRITFRPGGGDGPAGFQTYLRERETRLANTQAGWMMLGVALGAAIQSLGDVGIQRQIQSSLEAQAEDIHAWHDRGLGVLALIRTMEWETEDFNGMRARSFLSVILQPGLSPEDAMNRWNSQDQMTAGPPRGWRMRPTEYLWIE